LENVLTIQLLGKEDQVADDAITSEEKWSLYVDQFVQLSTIENSNMKRRDPFLKRNLPSQVGEDPPVNVETKSGLELKICVNTYKIFFVDNTEDYFRRKRTGHLSDSSSKRSAKFKQWLDQAWKRGFESEAQALEKSFADLVK
jgi:paired amphipathic helix protein Sin3a